MKDLKISQNFITDAKLIKRLVDRTDIQKSDTVVDIGAGEGVITYELAQRCDKVISIELDRSLFWELTKKFDKAPNVRLLNIDVLDYQLPHYDYKVFSNIPFNITSKIIEKLFFSAHCPKSAYLIVQKEAADRTMGIGEGYLISQLIKTRYDLKNIHNFKKTDFNPAPNVDVVMLEARKKVQSLIEDKDMSEYYDFLTYIFLQQKPSIKLRLNKLFTNIQMKFIFQDLKINPDSTIKNIEANLWAGLYYKFRTLADPHKKLLIWGCFKEYLKNTK